MKKLRSLKHEKKVVVKSTTKIPVLCVFILFLFGDKHINIYIDQQSSQFIKNVLYHLYVNVTSVFCNRLTTNI